MRYIFSLILLCCFSCTVRAEIFSLWPGAKSSNNYNPLEAKEFSVEPVVVNGVKLEMRLGLIDRNIHDLMADLKIHFSHDKVIYGGQNIILSEKLADGWEQRYLLFRIREGMPMLQIAMKIPPKLPDQFEWPAALPITRDGKPFRIMYFPKRNAWYGAYATHTSPLMALEQISLEAERGGWVAVSQEKANLGSARGEIFIRPKPGSVMLINFADEGIGTSYVRPLAQSKKLDYKQ